MTSELYDLIIELRPETTSAGQAEHMKRKWSYLETTCAYLPQSQNCASQSTTSVDDNASRGSRQDQNKLNLLGGVGSGRLETFSEPRTGRHEEEYDRTSISDEQITDIHLDWVRATRQGESEEGLRTNTGASTEVSRLSDII